ncbi:hypothetical protein BKK79_10980 [Cupriavidus sp. USMAA2-4]|uniref:Uncharacterized protein n=1 Tax=Cupriavidus malaysiensis TaxID=367825 RepID=A0A1D9HXM6_9BURK|nr:MULTISPECIES: OB-fold putative lipoprotein [Cupriavidus]AOY92238.1 hypothetical protein BKK79_10980 [Cupriavidus sp. USMAA2-4]AOY98181.1 hypothetical protein BKK81_01845 [Cupriavidus sp. USMAHM13]AOZ04616.1 hypothetical protein BKK80_01220 [Cupriavidus malaysiensis]
MLNRTQQRLILAVGAAVLAMLWFAGNGKDQGTTDPLNDEAASEQTPASQPRGVPRNGVLDPVSIDPARPADRLPEYQADTILNDYRDNGGAADDRYRGSYFIVEGVASGVRRDENDAVYLEIRSSDPNQVVRARLRERQICGPGTRSCVVEQRASMVRRGQKVAVECNGAGLVDAAPLLVDCLVRGGAN